MIPFRFHTPCFQHQEEIFEQTKDRPQFAVFWEMGGGKSKYIIDLASYLYVNNIIDAVFTIAPNGVHANWDMPGEGIQRHLMPELLEISGRLTWYSKRSQHKATKDAYLRMMRSKFAWFFMAVDAINTKDAYKAAEYFLKRRRVLFVIDEAQRIKNSKAQCTKKLMKLRNASQCSWRRILTGTPVDQKPFDIYAPIEWLMPGYWMEQGIGGDLAFKHTFADWFKAKMPNGHEMDVQRFDKKTGRLVYKNLEYLTKMVRPISSRLLKEDIFDLPEKLYSRAYYELSPAHRKLYDQMEQEFAIWWEENTVPSEENPDVRILMSSAELPITRQLRLHQLAMGYVTLDDGEIKEVSNPNPALELLRELTVDLPHSAIIWCRFRKDVELVEKMLGNSAVSIHGGVPGEDRTRHVQAFQAGDVPFIIGTNAMAEGWTLTRAKTAIYYSNDRRLGKRKQSEDRAHRPGQNQNLNIIDMLAQNTISELILDALIHGNEVAMNVMGDKIRKKWI